MVTISVETNRIHGNLKTNSEGQPQTPGAVMAKLKKMLKNWKDVVTFSQKKDAGEAASTVSDNGMLEPIDIEIINTVLFSAMNRKLADKNAPVLSGKEKKDVCVDMEKQIQNLLDSGQFDRSNTFHDAEMPAPQAIKETITDAQSARQREFARYIRQLVNTPTLDLNKTFVELYVEVIVDRRGLQQTDHALSPVSKYPCTSPFVWLSGFKQTNMHAT